MQSCWRVIVETGIHFVVHFLWRKYILPTPPISARKQTSTSVCEVGIWFVAELGGIRNPSNHYQIYDLLTLSHSEYHNSIHDSGSGGMHSHLFSSCKSREHRPPHSNIEYPSPWKWGTRLHWNYETPSAPELGTTPSHPSETREHRPPPYPRYGHFGRVAGGSAFITGGS